MIKQFYISKHKNYMIIQNYHENYEDVVILVHSFLSNKVEKEFFYSQLSKAIIEKFNISTAMFDFTGHGDSPGDLSSYKDLKKWVEEMKEIISILKLKYKNIHIVAMGLGIFISMKAIKEYILNVASLTLINPTTRFEMIGNLAISSNEEITHLDRVLGAKLVPVENSLFTQKFTVDNVLLHEELKKLGTYSYDNVVERVNNNLLLDISKLNFEEIVNELNTKIHIVKSEFHNVDLSRNVNRISIVPNASFEFYNDITLQRKVFKLILNFYQEVITYDGK